MEQGKVKECIDCGKAYPIEEFSTWKDRTGKTGRRDKCSKCRGIRTKRYQEYIKKIISNGGGNQDQWKNVL